MRYYRKRSSEREFCHRLLRYDWTRPPRFKMILAIQILKTENLKQTLKSIRILAMSDSEDRYSTVPNQKLSNYSRQEDFRSWQSLHQHPPRMEPSTLRLPGISSFYPPPPGDSTLTPTSASPSLATLNQFSPLLSPSTQREGFHCSAGLAS